MSELFDTACIQNIKKMCEQTVSQLKLLLKKEYLQYLPFHQLPIDQKPGNEMTCLKTPYSSKIEILLSKNALKNIHTIIKCGT